MSARALGIVVLASLALACGKTEEVRALEPTEPAPAPRHACAVEAEKLRTQLHDLAADGYVPSDAVVSRADRYRYLSRPLPIVPLVRVDAPPERLAHSAIVASHRGQLRFGDEHARIDDAKALAVVFASAADSGLSPGFGFGGVGYSYMYQPVVLLVAEDEPWSDVVRIVDAALRAGFAQASFVFEVKPRVSPPRDSAVARRMLAIASDAEEMPWKVDVAAAEELARRSPSCPALAAPFSTHPSTGAEMEDQLTAFVKDAPDAFRACECHADPDAVEAFAWVRFGRHWGPTTVSHQLEIAKADETPTTLAASPRTPWRDMARAVIEASKAKKPVRFAVR